MGYRVIALSGYRVMELYKTPNTEIMANQIGIIESYKEDLI